MAQPIERDEPLFDLLMCGYDDASCKIWVHDQAAMPTFTKVFWFAEIAGIDVAILQPENCTVPKACDSAVQGPRVLIVFNPRIGPLNDCGSLGR